MQRIIWISNRFNSTSKRAADVDEPNFYASKIKLHRKLSTPLHPVIIKVCSRRVHNLAVTAGRDILQQASYTMLFLSRLHVFSLKLPQFKQVMWKNCRVIFVMFLR